MVITVAILVWLAIGLLIGLIVWRDSVFGFAPAPSLVDWVGVALFGVPMLMVALLLQLFDRITGRR